MKLPMLTVGATQEPKVAPQFASQAVQPAGGQCGDNKFSCDCQFNHKCCSIGQDCNCYFGVASCGG